MRPDHAPSRLLVLGVTVVHRWRTFYEGRLGPYMLGVQEIGGTWSVSLHDGDACLGLGEGKSVEAACISLAHRLARSANQLTDALTTVRAAMERAA